MPFPGLRHAPGMTASTDSTKSTRLGNRALTDRPCALPGGQLPRSSPNPASSDARQPKTSHLRRIGGRHRCRQPDRGSDPSVCSRHAPFGSGRGAWRIRRAVRSQGRRLCRPDPGRRQRRRRHQGEDRHRERPVRYDRNRPCGHVRQRHCRSGRRATVFPRLFRLRQTRRECRLRRRSEHRRGLRAIRMRI